MIKLSSWKQNKNPFTFLDGYGCYVFHSNKIIFINKNHAYVYNGTIMIELEHISGDDVTITHRFVSDGRRILTRLGDCHEINNTSCNIKFYKNGLDVYVIYQWIHVFGGEIINITLNDDRLIFGLKLSTGLRIIDFNLAEGTINPRWDTLALTIIPDNIFICRDENSRTYVYYQNRNSLNVWDPGGIHLVLDIFERMFYAGHGGEGRLYATNGMNLFRIICRSAEKISYLATVSPSTIKITKEIQINDDNNIFAFGENAFWTFHLGEIRPEETRVSQSSPIYKYNRTLLHDNEEKDVILLCMNNEKVLVNKIFLKNSCDYFRSIISTKWNDCGIRKRIKTDIDDPRGPEPITIDCLDTSAFTMKVIVTFIYTSTIIEDFTPEDFFELCKTAQKFDMKSLYYHLISTYESLMDAEEKGKLRCWIIDKDKDLVILKSLYKNGEPWTIPFKEIWLSRYISMLPGFEWCWEELFNIVKIEELMYDIICLKHSL